MLIVQLNNKITQSQGGNRGTQILDKEYWKAFTSSKILTEI